MYSDLRRMKSCRNLLHKCNWIIMLGEKRESSSQLRRVRMNAADTAAIQLFKRAFLRSQDFWRLPPQTFSN